MPLVDDPPFAPGARVAFNTAPHIAYRVKAVIPWHGVSCGFLVELEHGSLPRVDAGSLHPSTAPLRLGPSAHQSALPRTPAPAPQKSSRPAPPLDSPALPDVTRLF